MKFAIIGFGKWGQTFERTLKNVEGAELVGICCSDRRFESLSPEKLGYYIFYGDYEKMLRESEADTIIIATHPDSHFEYSQLALLHGKNVICEKPCMFSLEQFAEIESCRNGKLFYVDYTNIHHKVIGEMQDAIHHYVRRLTLNLVNTGNGPVRSSYTDLWDYGSHVVSVIYTLFPKRAFCLDEYNLDKNGNHYLRLSNQDVEIEAIFGNKSPVRVHSFELTAGRSVVSWSNDKSENPLAVMLEKCSKGKLQTNIELSKIIYSTLSTLEIVNKRQ